jgi:NAD(P)-dependent dehydrogenase (short-subunit alcohol dehydrogenase family)
MNTDLLQGRVCLVTGASSGIGKATAVGLARMGATVVIVCRDEGRGQAALDEIRTATGSQSAEMMLADLSSLDSVRALAEEYKSRHEHLHVLVNNAGVYYTKRHVTVDGLEAMFAVNYLARFLLTNLLLDVLKASAPSRVVNVAGAYHSSGRIDFDDLQGERSFKGARANHQSKLADVLFTYELARRLEGAGVTANCLHPGIVATSLVEKDEDFPRLLKVLYKLFKPIARSPEKGAETPLYLASSPEVEGTTGRYFVNRKEAPSSPESHDAELAQRLWNVSAELARLT